MKQETFDTIQRIISEDPLTERQAAQLFHEEELLSVHQAAEWLGIRECTLYTNKNIPRLKIGGKIRFSKSALIKHMQENC